MEHTDSFHPHVCGAHARSAGEGSLAHRRIAQHRSVMRKLYFGSCVLAGLFTLLPGRLLGNLLWQRLA